MRARLPPESSQQSLAPLVEDLVHRRNHEQRQHRRRDHAADHRAAERRAKIRALADARARRESCRRSARASSSESDEVECAPPRSAPRARRRPRSSCAHFAKSISRIAFFATMPMSSITPIRLMMLSVSRVMSSASDDADQRQRQRHENRQRIEERSELHDENQIHQHHRDAEREKHAAEHLVLTLRSGRPARCGIPAAAAPCSRAASRRATRCRPTRRSTFAPIVTTRCALIVVDLRRPVASRDRRDLAERHERRRPPARRPSARASPAVGRGRSRSRAPCAARRTCT